MSLLKQALLSELPFIQISSDDVLNFPAVLKHYVGATPEILNPERYAKIRDKHPSLDNTKVYYCLNQKLKPTSELYLACVHLGLSIVWVNRDIDTAFNAGSVHLPVPLLRSFLELQIPEESIDEVIIVLNGLSLKEVGEVIRLCSTKYKKLTPLALLGTRRECLTGTTGLQSIDTKYDFYLPNPDILNWVDREGKLFQIQDVPDMLRPRGLLFTGGPGLGKSLGAKYIAKTLGLNLFHLDLSSLMAKYVGESEQNLASALQKIDQSAPCVVLIDEIEKSFMSSGDGGVTSKLLAQLLWWLQAHKSNVITIMTTNDQRKIPPELYRPGRIDKIIRFTGLGHKDAKVFISRLCQNLQGWFEALDAKDVFNISMKLYGELELTSLGQKHLKSHAEVTQAVYEEVKTNILLNLDEDPN